MCYLTAMEKEGKALQETSSALTTEQIMVKAHADQYHFSAEGHQNTQEEDWEE